MHSSDMMKDLEITLQRHGSPLVQELRPRGPVLGFREMSKLDYSRVLGYARALESRGFEAEAQYVMEQLQERLQ